MKAKANTPREVVEKYLAATGSGDADAVADLFAVDSIIEMPFGPKPGENTVFTGRAGHRARLKAFAPAVKVEKVEKVALFETSDPEVVVVEYDYHATAVPTGKHFVNRYVSVVRVRDGEIVHSRDYANPLVSAQAFGRSQQLLESIKPDES